MRAHPKVPGAKVYLGERVLRLLDIAQVDARERGQPAVGPLHLLAGVPLETRSGAAEVLREQGVTLPRLEDAIAKRPPLPQTAATLAPPSPPGVPMNEAPSLLAKYARDLTALAAAGKFASVVGRDLETRRLMQILGRQNKNNPILVGDPGVGKTAIVEGLAARIAAGDVPLGLKDKRILALDIGSLVAGAKFRGEFEDRIRGIIAEVKEAGGEVLLFFDEIHTLMGAGQGEGGIDAADLLKPALARGEITCIGATTLDEYRLHIEKDPAFERRFLPVLVEEPGEEICIAMLRSVKRRYEEKHHVRIQDAALVAAVKLSRRYVAGRALPDKAIDLLDEAGSRLRLELDSHPDEIDVLERRERSLRLELAAIGADRDPDAVDRAARLTRARADIEAELGPMREKWQAELGAIAALEAATSAAAQAQTEAQIAEKAGDLSRAAEIRFGRLPALATAVEAAEAQLRTVQGPERLLEDAVEPVHVARVVGDWTGIPVARMLEGERQKVLGIESNLTARVVGQEQAVRLVGHAVKRARAGLADAGRPIGSFLFLGPTGVGKTELAKALASFLFDDDSALTRIDMSEYMEKHSVARMIGAPPGYVGYEEGGALTEVVRRRPYQVILFDEVEKAHPDVFNVLLQVLDDGRLTDGQGRTVDFRNTLIVLTSNLGSDILARQGEGEDSSAIREQVMDVVRAAFRPEFLNRLDDILLFHRLTRAQMAGIVDIQLKRLEQLLADRKMTIELDDKARKWLANAGYDPVYGARPLKRVIQRELQNPLAGLILEGRIKPGEKIRVGVKDGKLSINGETLTAEAA